MMLRKIDCVMIRVDDVEVAAAYYAKVFGLRPQWSGDDSIGLAFPETDAEVVLHNDPDIPSSAPGAIQETCHTSRASS